MFVVLLRVVFRISVDSERSTTGPSTSFVRSPKRPQCILTNFQRVLATSFHEKYTKMKFCNYGRVLTFIVLNNNTLFNDRVKRPIVPLTTLLKLSVLHYITLHYILLRQQRYDFPVTAMCLVVDVVCGRLSSFVQKLNVAL